MKTKINTIGQTATDSLTVVTGAQVDSPIDQKVEQFVRVKDTWRLLAMSRSTFYDKTVKLRDMGFPQVYKQGSSSVCALPEIVEWQQKVLRGEANF